MIPKSSPDAPRTRRVSVAVVLVLAFVAVLAIEPVRVACVIVLWLLASGRLVVRLLLPADHRSGPSGWAQSIAVGMVGSVLMCLALFAVRLPLNRWSVGLAFLLALVVLARFAGCRVPTAECARHKVRRAAAASLRRPVLFAVGAVPVVVLVWAVAGTLPSRLTAESSTRIYFRSAADAMQAMHAPPGATRGLLVTVVRAPGDTNPYQLGLQETGRGPRTVARVPLTTPVTVAVPVVVPRASCRYQVVTIGRAHV